MGWLGVIAYAKLYLLVIGLAEFGHYGVCKASESNDNGSRDDDGLSNTSNKRPRREATKLTEESVVYDLVPFGVEADNVTRLQVDNLQEALGLQGTEEEMEFSFCLWFQLRLNTSVPTLFSYAVSETKTNAIFVYVNEGFFSYMNDITRSFTKLKYTFGPLQWYHVCLVKERLSTDSQQTPTGGRTTSEASYNITLYLDGHKVYEDPSDVPFPLGGILVIGQDQDGMGSAFVKDQALIGRVSFVAFAEALGPGDVGALFRCDVVREPIPIAWRAYGRVSNTSFDICRSSGYRGTLLPYKTDDRRKAQNLCEMVNMRLALPRDEDENRMYSELLSRDDVCHGTPFLSHNIGWLGISYDEDSGTLAEADSLRTFSKLDRNISDSKSPSVVLMSNGLWRSNWTRYGCPLCYGKPSGEFYLLGSEESETEVQPEVFYPRVDQDGAFFLYSFEGITVEKRDKWKFIDTNTNTTIASTEEPYFLGRKPWELLNISNDSRFYSRSSQLMLTLTKCSLDEFTCNDGDCIPMKQRCDFRPDCADEGEDEITCNILDIAADYETGSPPPQRPFNITASVSIKKVSSIDIMTETLQVSMRFSIKWCDSRLTFKNLLDSNRVNYLGQHLSTLWLPQLVVLNEETLAGTAEASKDLFVVENGLPMRIGQDYVYRGAENSLVLKQKQSYYIACKFDMRAFPFDVQDCWINVTIGNAALDSMRLSAVLQNVDRNLKLNEYDVLACNLTVTRTTMVIRVTLRRYPDYHILSSYFPVFLLHLLGYGTLFIDPQDFQDRGAMSLTSLLVLISFYSDAAMTLPKTSYLKRIDVWYIFSITFLSLIIGVHLVTNKVRGLGNPPPEEAAGISVEKPYPLTPVESTSVFPFPAGGVKPKGSSPGLKKNHRGNFNASVLLVAKILFGVVYVLFHVFYWNAVLTGSY